MGLARLLPRPNVRPASVSGPCRSAGDRPRQPEGRRGEDDDHAEPRRRVRRAGLSRAAHRPRPAGEPDDVAGAEPGLDRAVDVRRARPPAADGAGDRTVRGRHRRLVDRPRRRRHGAVEPDRPRARAREGAGADQGSLRLHPHRHAPVARAADRQRVRRGDRRDRPGADRVPLAARARAAREHALDGAREPEPARRDHRDRADDVRQAPDALARGRRDPARELRRPGLQHAHPQDGPLRRGAGEGRRPCSPTSRPARLLPCTATWRRRCSVARNRASMREGPLAELFRATEAAQRGQRRRTSSRSCRPRAFAGTRRRAPNRRNRRRSAPSLRHPPPSRRRRSAARSPAGSSRCPTSRRASSAAATAPRTSRSSASSASAAPA